MIKNICLLVLLGISVVASWQYLVNKSGRDAANAAYAQLKTHYDDTVADYDKYRAAVDPALNNATTMAIQAGALARETQIELDKQRSKNKFLLILLDNAEKQTPDSSWVRVSPVYKWGCDSLRRATITLNNLIVQYEQDNQAHVDALNYETFIRDSALKVERGYNAFFKRQLGHCIDAISNIPTRRPVTQLYAGMAAWGNAITPLGGGEINLGLKTKSDQFYEIKGAYMGRWWVGVGTKFKISFK